MVGRGKTPWDLVVTLDFSGDNPTIWHYIFGGRIGQP